MSTLDPRRYVVTPDTTVSDVDLDTEVVTFRGKRLTEERAEKVAKDVLRRAGRPSLTGQSAHTPRVGVRLPDDVRARLQERADREHKSLSAVVREAVEAYVKPGGAHS
jgi:predicted HicB family RNase H-like nuclease